MKILLCTKDAKRFTPFRNFLKVPLEITEPEKQDTTGKSGYCCTLYHGDTDDNPDNDFLITSNILIEKTNNKILWAKNEKAAGVKADNSYLTLHSLLEDIKNSLATLTENETVVYETPVINEKLAMLESILRQIFINYGQPFLKVKYLPSGYSWGICISHDVDNLSLKEHMIDDVSVKSLASSYIELYHGHRNIKSTLSYTFACIKCLLFGSKDPYDNIEEWIELEKNIPSTFYFAMTNGRGIKYSKVQIKNTVKLLAGTQFEIGIHGQNNSDPQVIKEEVEELFSISGKKPAGIRMHYLSFSRDTWQLLESAGYLYDTTYGFSREIGYRSGTVMPYHVPVTTDQKIIEIPLHIMDTTLFNVLYMNLGTEMAISITEKTIEQCRKYNGVMSALIHQRSISSHFKRYREWYLWLRDLISSDELCWIVSNNKLAEWHRQWYDLEIDYRMTEDSILIITNQELERAISVEVSFADNTTYIEIPAGKTEVTFPVK